MADINFTCPSCNQLLTAGDELIGREIACPSCNETIIVQEQTSTGGGGHGRHAVPVGGGDPNMIQKPSKPLDRAAKAAIKVRCKTFRHHDHIASDKDGFDDAVSAFLAQTGEENIVSIESIQYTWVDKETKTPMSDYGAMVFYRGL